MISRRLLASASAVAVAFASHIASAQAVDPLAAKFGARQTVRDVGLSPEGKQIVVVAAQPGGGETALVISLADGKSVPVFSAKGNTEQITNCQFVTEAQLVCELYLREGTGRSVDRGTRMVSLSADGKSMKLLTARDTGNAYFSSRFGGQIIDYNVPDNPQAVLMTRYFPPENRTGTLTGSSSSGLGVEQVDVVTLQRKRVEAPRDSAIGYATDGHGSVRLMGMQPSSENGYAKRQVTYSVRPQGGSWTPLSTVAIDGGISQGFEPVAVDTAANAVYGLNSNGNFTALYKRPLVGAGEPSVVLSRGDTDIDGLLRIGRSQRIVGATYVTDRREAEYFDPALKQLSQSLQRALGGNRAVAIVDSTADEGKLLLYAGSDVDPGRYYLFDKQTKKLGELLPARPELVGIKLGEMKTVQYPAGDGTLIPAYLTLPPGSDGKNLPAIVMPHGGPSARDEWGFDWLSQYFVSRGFAVLQPNYRGSSGMGTEWYKKNGFKSWQTAIGDIDAAGRWLQSQGIAANGKLAIFGWSYGGYAALQSQVLDPDLFKAVVAVAPVTDLERLREERREYSDFYVVDNFIGTGAHIAAGSPARHADSFKAPVLLFHGDADTNVGVGESRLMQSKLSGASKSVRYVEFPGLDHQLDDTAARTKLLSESAAFIATNLGVTLR